MSVYGQADTWTTDLTRYLATKDSGAIDKYIYTLMRSALKDDPSERTWLALRTAGLILRARESLR